ncbi:MAG: hypothetical protein ACRBDX_01480 [Gammaproteobacteria bacterium]
MDNNPSMLLVVQVNGSPMLEYDRKKSLTSGQQHSLLLMEKKFAEGIELHGLQINEPSLEQRIEFVTANLISAVLTDEEAIAAASCAYIAHALPDLKQIKALEKDGEVSIELVFDREYQPEENLSFVPLDKIGKSELN